MSDDRPRPYLKHEDDTDPACEKCGCPYPENATCWNTYLATLEKLRAAESALQQEREEWQPIETAPRDGTLIWAYEEGKGRERRQYIAWWVEHGPGRDEGQYWHDDSDSEPAPTHWRPLTEPAIRSRSSGTSNG